MDVKPWDDETDMAAMEKNVRSIELDGLLWGASKLVAVGYGIKKLQITCVVEDDKVVCYSIVAYPCHTTENKTCVFGAYRLEQIS